MIITVGTSFLPSTFPFELSERFFAEARMKTFFPDTSSSYTSYKTGLSASFAPENRNRTLDPTSFSIDLLSSRPSSTAKLKLVGCSEVAGSPSGYAKNMWS